MLCLGRIATLQKAGNAKKRCEVPVKELCLLQWSLLAQDLIQVRPSTNLQLGMIYFTHLWLNWNSTPSVRGLLINHSTGNHTDMISYDISIYAIDQLSSHRLGYRLEKYLRSWRPQISSIFGESKLPSCCLPSGKRTHCC